MKKGKILKIILAIVVIKWLFDSFKKAEAKPEITLPTGNNFTPFYGTGSRASSSYSYAKTKNLNFEAGETEFTVNDFPPDANLADFDLLLNNDELINASVDEENADFTIVHLGSGSYKITIVSETLTLDPESHTLILKLR